MLGLNHRTAPVEIREKFSIPQDRIVAALEQLEEAEGLSEAVVLSTCNRSEIYAVVDEDWNLAAVSNLWEQLTGMELSEQLLADYAYAYWGRKCIEHLLRVSASLDSLVLGEGQILSQVKHAYATALEHGATDTILNLLFNRAIAAGKRVRTETRIAYSAVSVSYAAVELAKKVLGTIADKRVLLFGAGKMAELTATHLLSQGAPALYVANHHLEKAQALAERFRGRAVAWNNVYDIMKNIDIIITSTGAPHYVIREPEMVKAAKERFGRPLVLIDIAVPRDVDPEVADLPNIDLFNIDDLESVVDDNLQHRQQEAIEAEAIVKAEVTALVERYQYLSMQPVMYQLSEKAEYIRQMELKRAVRKLRDLSEDELKVVENMTKMLVRKLLREPMSSVHDAVGTEQEQELKEAMQNLFQLDEMGNEVDADE